MNLILKSQWYYRVMPSGFPSLTKEDFHQEFPVDSRDLLDKLSKGIDSELLTDKEFEMATGLIDRGFVATSEDIDAPAWELTGSSYTNIREQFEHNTYSILEFTADPEVASRVKGLLDRAGMKTAPTGEEPRLILLFTDSFQNMKVPKGNVLPIVCNRMRVTIGPMIFPWSTDIGEEVKKSDHYMPRPLYTLPEVYHELQCAWIAASVLQFVGLNRLRYVKHFVEFNMAKQEFALWPVTS